MDPAHDLAREHLLLRLRTVNCRVRRAMERQAARAARLARAELTAWCITDEEARLLIDDADALLCGDPRREPPDARRVATEAEIRDRVAEAELRKHAATCGIVLPLIELAEGMGLTPFDVEALLVCAAPELDRTYERLYAYVLDDLSRRTPSVELIVTLMSDSLAERLAHRRSLGALGALRRLGLLQASGGAPTELRSELCLGDGVLDFLLTGDGDPAMRFVDPAEVRVDREADLPLWTGASELGDLGTALAHRVIDAAGIWGGLTGEADEAGLVVARRVGAAVRRLRLCELPSALRDCREAVERAVRAASTLGAVLWVPTDALPASGAAAVEDLVIETLATCDVPLVLSGRTPWRHPGLLAARTYAEHTLSPLDFAGRDARWAAAVDVDHAERGDLSARFRLSSVELRAAVRLAATQARLTVHGEPASLATHLERACVTVTRRRSHAFANIIEPRRHSDDLVLPPEQHAQVSEVGHFFRTWPRMLEPWGFGRTFSAAGGIKVLFTGDSGTGKTLAAEVIASELQLPLMKVDLARVVSKWVGETERNLAAAFEEAEQSQAVLFFDEADALFGKRGEVERGTDRYANLEVSYLLQRLEDFGGLVILASNLKDNIDSAFIRRFQISVHFPRPGEAERRRIWERVFPLEAPTDAGVDLDALARLDMTGGSIAGAVRMAAMLAAAAGADHITMGHLAEGVARQYEREARLLTRSELGELGGVTNGDGVRT